MTPRPFVAIALAACLLIVACDGEATGENNPSGQGLNTVVSDLIVEGRVTPAAVRLHQASDPANDASASDRGIGLDWTSEPSQLQVFRSTAVHFRVKTPPADHATATCSWNFGDGSPTAEGCTVSHTFHGGRADQVVTLTLHDADWQWTSTRTIPLERLKVTAGLSDEEKVAVGELPKRPTPGDTTFRFAVIADTAAKGGVPTSVEAGLGALLEHITPDLVIHSGGVVTPDASSEDVQSAREHLNAQLERGDATLAWTLSPSDRAAKVSLGRPGVQMVNDQHFPERYSFTFKGAFFLMVSVGGDGVDEAVIKWMREELAKAGIYDARYVVSYLPLHKFGDEHVGSLDKRFRLYELFLRARVTAFFSAGYRVYFNGHYGALPVVSVGAMAGTGGTLSGGDFAQPNSFVVVDQIGGAKERVFAVEGPSFDKVLDEGLLPESVEVYTR